jgi:hypothetical protein
MLINFEFGRKVVGDGGGRDGCDRKLVVERNSRSRVAPASRGCEYRDAVTVLHATHGLLFGELECQGQ